MLARTKHRRFLTTKEPGRYEPSNQKNEITNKRDKKENKTEKTANARTRNHRCANEQKATVTHGKIQKY